MVATIKKSQHPEGGKGTPTAPTRRSPRPHGVFQTRIEGRYRPVPVHQLAMAWWLYREKHLTARQLRVYFAAHEMHERRRYTQPDPDGRPRKPLYTLDEVRALIGSRASDADLTADVRALARIGLVTITDHAIEFAVSIDQVRVEDVSGFWSFLGNLPNTRRRVPVPRRTIRALAKGFTRAVTGMILALLIRSLFWHRPGGRAGEEGGYRVDGRTKCSWIAEAFGISRRSVTDARAFLLAAGWISELDCPQHELNRWGQRYTINVEAFGPTPVKGSTGVCGGRGGVGAADTAGHPPASSSIPTGTSGKVVVAGAERGGFASPAADNAGGSASPCLNTSASSTKRDLNTKRPAPFRSGPIEGSRKKKTRDRGRRKDRKPGGRGGALHGGPRLKRVVLEDLRELPRLLELHDQAVAAGHPVKGEAGRLAFVALAMRACRLGTDPVRLFVWMLREGRFDFITQADEDAAMTILKPPDPRSREGERSAARGPWHPESGGGVAPRPAVQPLGEFVAGLDADERVVHACLVTGKKHRLDPFRIARAEGWTRDRWDEAKLRYDLKERERWQSGPQEEEGGAW